MVGVEFELLPCESRTQSVGDGAIDLGTICT